MNLSRKDFIRQSVFSMGETLLKVGGTVWSAKNSLQSLPLDEKPENEPVPDLNTVARVDNQLCLAKNCGCYSCIERCTVEAIKLIPGVGLRINQQLCTGCGTCEYVCPVTPRAIRMQARTTIQAPSADHAELSKQKGESPC